MKAGHVVSFALGYGLTFVPWRSLSLLEWFLLVFIVALVGLLYVLVKAFPDMSGFGW